MKAKTWLWIPLLAVSIASPAVAAPLIPEVRPRAGVGFEPDEFVVGAQVFLRGRLLGLARVAPSLDFGFGSDVSTVALNLDVISTPIAVGERLGLYGGVGVWWVNFNPDEGDGDSEFGFGFVAGTDIGERLYVEGRFGVDEMPDVRLLAGLRLLKKSE